MNLIYLQSSFAGVASRLLQPLQRRNGFGSVSGRSECSHLADSSRECNQQCSSFASCKNLSSQLDDLEGPFQKARAAVLDEWEARELESYDQWSMIAIVIATYAELV